MLELWRTGCVSLSINCLLRILISGDQGLITGRTTAFCLDPKKVGVAAQQRVATVQSHEVAHMWFGDITVSLVFLRRKHRWLTMGKCHRLWLGGTTCKYINFFSCIIVVDSASGIWMKVNKFSFWFFLQLCDSFSVSMLIGFATLVSRNYIYIWLILILTSL